MLRSEISPDDIAAAMEMPLDGLWGIARKVERYYHPTSQETDAKGKTRIFDKPKYWFKKKLKLLHRYLLKEFRFPHQAHGGIRGRSSMSSARRHLGRSTVIVRDVENCFPSISRLRLKNRLKELGFRCDTAELLSLLLTVHDRVPQGSPPSTDAVNLYFWLTDLEIRDKVAPYGGRYSRITDDLVVSTNEPEAAADISSILEKSIERLGLKVSQKKKSSGGLQSSHAPQFVHSLLVNSGLGLAPSRAHKKEALQVAREFVASAREVAPGRLKELAILRSKLEGWIGYFARIPRSPVRHLRSCLHAGDRHLKRKFEAAGIEAQFRNWWIGPTKSGRWLGPEKISRIWKRKTVSQVEGATASE